MTSNTMSYPALPGVEVVEDETSSSSNVPKLPKTASVPALPGVEVVEDETSSSSNVPKLPKTASVPALPGVHTAENKTSNTSNLDPEVIRNLINLYRDPSKWADDEFSTDIDDVDVEDDGFKSDTNEDPEEPDDTERRNFLRHSEKKALIKLLSSDPTDGSPEDPLEKFKKWAPNGLEVSGKQLLAAIHPDRFLQEDEKKLATMAFQVLDEAMDGDRAQNIKGLHEGEVVVDFLEEYHEKAHIDATEPLIQLYDAFKRGEPIDVSSPSESVKKAHQDLDAVNNKIKEENVKIRNHPDFGVVDVDQIMNCWKPHHGEAGPTLLWKLCELNHYPMGWAHQPPKGDYTYDMDRGEYWIEAKNYISSVLHDLWESDKLKSDIADLVKHIQATQKQSNKKLAQLNKKSGRPKRLNEVNVVDIMAHYSGLRLFLDESMNEHLENLGRHLKQKLVSQDLPESWLPNQCTSASNDDIPGDDTNFPAATKEEPNAPFHFKQLGGNKAVISVTPRTIEFTLRPGFTYAGEKIIVLQKVGTFSARFVIESEDGSRQIVDSGRAGGKLVLQAAQNAGVPCTLTSYEDIREIELAMASGKPWRVTYVAVSQWDTDRLSVKGLPKLPYVVIGIYILRKEVHVSRSILGKLIGAKAAENIVVQELGGDVDEGLTETLMGRLPMGKRLADRPVGLDDSTVKDNRNAPQEKNMSNMDQQSQDLLKMMTQLLQQFTLNRPA